MDNTAKIVEKLREKRKQSGLSQKERMRSYAKSMDIEIAGEYEDAGRSGKSISGRPEFQRMIRDTEDQRDNVSFVLVFKLSRFGRSAADVLNTLQIMQDHGQINCRFILCNNLEEISLMIYN